MAQDSKHGEESEEKYAQKQEKKSGEKDRKQEEDKNGKGKNQVSDDYEDGPPDIEQQQQPGPPSQSAGGRTFYFTVPIRPLSGHIPQEYLDRLTLYYALYGTVFAAVGAIAIVLPLVFGVEVVTLLPWLLVLGGSVTLLVFLLICGAPGTSAFLLLSALHLAAGIYLLLEPETGSRFTLLLTAWFLLHGAIKLFMAIAVRKVTTWPVVLVSGIASLLLAFVIFILTSRFGLKLVSISFGADLAFTGISLLLISIMGFLGKENRSVSDADLLNEPFLQGNGDGVGSAAN